MTSHIPQPKTRFRLPPDVSFEKQRLPDAWAYVFRHRVLGELGRILLQELDDGRCHISCEVVGDPSDPMTTQQTAIFKPLGLELTRQMEAAFGATPEEAGPVDPPRRPPETKEVRARSFLASVAAPWWRCSSSLLRRLIRGALKITPARCTRRITASTCRLGSLGPALGEGPLIDRPADVLKVWPPREPIQRLPPAQFNRLLDQVATRHFC
jgi:hypothetical protein